MKEKLAKALVPGSFDPITIGHMNIIKRAAKLFDRVYVTAFINAAKTPRFDADSKLEMIKAACAELDNVVCDKNDGMLADYCAENGITAVVKGVRNSADFEYEKNMAEINRDKNPELDTLFLPAEPGFEEISSSALCKLIIDGGDYEKYLPKETVDIVKKLLRDGKTNIK